MIEIATTITSAIHAATSFVIPRRRAARRSTFGVGMASASLLQRQLVAIVVIVIPICTTIDTTMTRIAIRNDELAGLFRDAQRSSTNKSPASFEL